MDDRIKITNESPKSQDHLSDYSIEKTDVLTKAIYKGFIIGLILAVANLILIGFPVAESGFGFLLCRILSVEGEDCWRACIWGGSMALFIITPIISALAVYIFNTRIFPYSLKKILIILGIILAPLILIILL